MAPPAARHETSPLCLTGCWSVGAFPPRAAPHRGGPGGAARSARAEFAATTAAVFFPDTVFTCHESLPAVEEAFSAFSAAYPRYGETELTDQIRENEYDHLTGRTCLDYSGFGLFSGSQFPCSGDTPAPAPSSSSAPANPDFDISYRFPGPETATEGAIRRRTMRFLNFHEEDYSMICTASRASAFKLLAEIFPFPKNRRLLTVYDHESEAVSAVIQTSRRRGAKVMAAEFSWPSLRIRSTSLNKMIISKRKKKNRGLIVFPLQSLVSGARYSYQWMKLAQENGWHVALDAAAMAPKDLDTFGLSLIRPDFLICSFFKVLGENPAGFAALLVRRSASSIPAPAGSAGIVSLVPARAPSDLQRNFSDTDHSGNIGTAADLGNGRGPEDRAGDLNQNQNGTEIEEERPEEILEIECRGLNHADSLGMIRISCRLRCIVNWLVNALAKLQHPHPEKGETLIRIYGPSVKYDRGPAIAFNVFDWKGEKIEPALVQKLADRCNISLSCGFLCNIWFSEKHERDRDRVLERKEKKNSGGSGGGAAAIASTKKGGADMGIAVVSAAFGFLASFDDAYRLWAFAAKFLDADFVERERWRYLALNQRVVEV